MGRLRRVASPAKWAMWTARTGGTRSIAVGDAAATIHTRDRMEHRHAVELHGENEHIAWFLTRLDDGLVWDIGAHIGTYAVLAADAGARVEAVEPDPAMARRLRRNVTSNGLDDRVTVREVALAGPDRRAVDIEQHNEWAGDGVQDNQIAVPPATLAAATGPPDAIKVDIEGLETSVVSALDALLPDVHTVLVEIHDGVDGDELAAVLAAAGLSVTRTGEHLRGER